MKDLWELRLFEEEPRWQASRTFDRLSAMLGLVEHPILAMKRQRFGEMIPSQGMSPILNCENSNDIESNSTWRGYSGRTLSRVLA